MASDDPWTHLRIRQSTLLLLRIEVELLCRAHEAGYTECPAYNPDPDNPQAGHIPLNAMLRIMLAERMNHRQRRKRVAAAQKARRAAEK